LIPEVIVLAFEIVLEQADYHDALIDGAEIEALYENTHQMLNASADIYDEVVCRCIDDLESRPQSKLMSFSCVLSIFGWPDLTVCCFTGGHGFGWQ
jgi:hypothetical protein